MKRIAALLGCIVLVSVAGCEAGVGGAPSSLEGADGGGKVDDPGSQRPEVCANGIDDNGNGKIDEHCMCTPGQTEACWPGDPSKRHTGMCKDGVQTCFADDSEFPYWSACEGAVLDCGTPDAGTPHSDAAAPHPDAAAPYPDAAAPHPDAAAPDAPPACVPHAESCTGGKDEDCDGLVDCADPDCKNDAACAPACEPWPDWEICGDGKDNDCNGKTDCDDPQCWSDDSCTCTESCTAGSWRWCDEANYCHWGAQVCGPDNRWGSCYETNERPAGCGDWYFYNVDCCVEAGQCCEAMDPFPAPYSVGWCQPVNVTCHAN